MKKIIIHSWKSLPRRRRRIIGWSAGAFLAYTVIGFLVLPIIVRLVAVKRLSLELDRTVVIRSVRMNPYAFSASIRGLLIKDKDGETLARWEEVYANFQLSSFFGKPWVFKEVRIVQPYGRVQMNPDRTLNFSDLLTKFAGPRAAKSPGPSKPLALEVDLLHIIGAEASYADLTPSTPFRRRMGPVEIKLTGFHTDPENKNPYSFTGTTDTGERFSWSGHFFLDPLRSHGELSVENVALSQYAPVYQDFLKFDIRDGIADMRAAYDVVWGTSTNMAIVTNAFARLRSFKLAEKGNKTNVAELALLSVNGASADAVARSGEIKSISVIGGNLLVRRTSDAKVNIIDLAQPAGTNVSGSILLMLQSVTNLFAQLLTSTNAASGVVREINVRDCRLTLEDLANARPVRLEVADVTFAATNLSNLPGSNFTASASFRWNTNGTVHADLAAAIAPPTVDAQFQLDHLELAPLGPYLDQFLSVFIVGSQLNMDGHVWLRTTNELGLNAAFSGNMQLERFASVDGDTGEDLVNFDSAKLTGINAQLNPPGFSLKELAVDKASANVVLEKDGTLNLARIARISGSNAPVAAVPSVKAVASEQPKSKKGFGDLRRQFGSMLRLYSATNLAGKPMPLKASVENVVIHDASLQVNDRTVSPQVRAALRAINGHVTGVSSEFDREIAADFHARLDQTGPVEIKAVLPPAGPTATNRFSVLLKNVDLNPAGPYSGKFLGYALRKGKVNVDMQYEMTDRKLKAQNMVVLDQLTLGEKIDSPDATKLPVKLAVAILKDRNGRIELEVPIEGSLDDPKFQLSKVITHTIVNVVTKIVTSPFAALGKLFGGKGEDVRFQEFQPGSSELTAASIEKLNAIVGALYERPGLEVEIEGSIDADKDRDALCHQKLEKEFRLRKWTALRKSEQERMTVEQISLTPEEFGQYLRQAHEAKFPASEREGAKTAQAQASSKTGTFQKGAEKLVKAEEVPVPVEMQFAMEHDLFASIDVSPDDYRTLAMARAYRVKAHVLQTAKVEQERIFLILSNRGASTNGSRVYLHLK